MTKNRIEIGFIASSVIFVVEERFRRARRSSRSTATPLSTCSHPRVAPRWLRVVTDGIQSVSILGEKFSSHPNPTLILFTRSSDLRSMNTIDFVLCRIREELRVMEVNSEQRAARFNIDFDDCPVFDSYSDDLDDGPVFDADPADLDDGWSTTLTPMPMTSTMAPTLQPL
jgi:hypothetical protein